MSPFATSRALWRWKVLLLASISLLQRAGCENIPTTKWSNISALITSSTSASSTSTSTSICNDFCELVFDATEIGIWYPTLFGNVIATSFVSLIGMNGSTRTEETVIPVSTANFVPPPEVTSWDPNFKVTDVNIGGYKFPYNYVAVNTLIHVNADLHFNDASTEDVCIYMERLTLYAGEDESHTEYTDTYRSDTFPQTLPFTSTFAAMHEFQQSDTLLSTRENCGQSVVVSPGVRTAGLVATTTMTVTSTFYQNVQAPTATPSPFCDYCMIEHYDASAFSWYPNLITSTVATSIVRIKKQNGTTITQLSDIKSASPVKLPPDIPVGDKLFLNATEYILRPGTTLTWPTTYIIFNPLFIATHSWTINSGPNTQCLQKTEVVTMTGTATETRSNGLPKGYVWPLPAGSQFHSGSPLPGTPLWQFATDLPQNCTEIAQGAPPFHLVPVLPLTVTTTIIDDDPDDFASVDPISKTPGVALTSVTSTQHTEPAAPGRTAFFTTSRTQGPPSLPQVTGVPRAPGTPDGSVSVVNGVPPAVATGSNNPSVAQSPPPVGSGAGTSITLTVNGSPISITKLPSGDIIFDGATIPTGQQIVVNGATVQIKPDGSIVVGGQSITPYAPGTVVSGVGVVSVSINGIRTAEVLGTAPVPSVSGTETINLASGSSNPEATSSLVSSTSVAGTERIISGIYDLSWVTILILGYLRF